MNIIQYLRKRNNYTWSIEKLFEKIREVSSLHNQITVQEVPYFSNGLFPRIKNIINAHKHQGDVNHITGDIHYISLGLKKNKTLLTIHDLGFMEQYKGIKRFILWLFLIYIPVKRVKYVTAISETTKNEIKKYSHCNADKIKVIPNFVSPVFRSCKDTFNSTIPTILQVGTLFNKNLERLIPALTDIPCKLLIIGRLAPSQIELLKENNIKYENLFNLSEEEVYDCYKKSNIVAFCSLLEGFGLPILEAQAVGRPVITSNVSSMPEIAGDGALFVNPYSIEEINTGIKKLIKDEPLKNTLITKGFKNVERFRLEAVAKMYTDIYQQIYNENSRQ